MMTDIHCRRPRSWPKRFTIRCSPTSKHWRISRSACRFLSGKPRQAIAYTARKKVIGMAKGIPVLEIFGPTIQGEGMVIGQKTMFVRTAGRDYSCGWCDSAFTWDGSAKKRYPLDDGGRHLPRAERNRRRRFFPCHHLRRKPGAVKAA